jgi:hypothetical protein
MHGDGVIGGGVVDTGQSTFDPVTNAQKMGRIQGVMLSAAIADISRARTMGGVLAWSLIGLAMAAAGLLFLYDLAFLGGGRPVLIGFGVLFGAGGLRILAAQPGNVARLFRPGRSHKH